MFTSQSPRGVPGALERNYRIELTAQERDWADRIDLGEDHDHIDAHDIYLANGPLILALLTSLEARGAVPEHWLQYWTDPDSNPGRIKASRRGLFERNGCNGEDIYTHPNFVKHLRYLLLGSELPRHVSETFVKRAGNPRWISSGEAIDLGKFARKLARDNALAAPLAAGEFFKLALENGFSLSAALTLREAVGQMR